MVLSFSLPAMLGSRASKIPSSLESNPAFSYFQGVVVRSSRSLLDAPLSEQPVKEKPVAIIRVPIISTGVTMVQLAFILHSYRLEGPKPSKFKLPDQII